MDGKPFGRYLLIERIGHGGMGEVWRAHDTAIDRTVALKMLLPSAAKNHKYEQRFRREARAAARLDHPNVVPIYDVGEIHGRLYVTMRLINGHDLQALVDVGPLEPARAVSIIGQIAGALQAAHTVGLVHRDVKPSNILVTEHDFAYLIDFGIARAAGEPRLTSIEATVGTWSYMAPERFRPGEAEPSSDIYSLACVLFECLTAQLPFPAKTPEQIALAHMSTPPPPPSTHRPGISPALDAVVLRGLAKDTRARYGSTVELASAARAAVVPVAPPKHSRTGTRPPAPPPPPLALRYAARSDRGLICANNEDSCYAGSRLLAVADGKGGPNGGAAVSQLVVAELAYLDDPEPYEYLLAQLDAAVRDANAAIAARIQMEPDLDGMWTTLTAMLFEGNRFAIAHIGNSRGYLLRDGELTQITKDDSYVQMLVDEGRITAEAARSHPQRSLLIRAMTGRDIDPALAMREARAGDRYLLCSQGLWEPVNGGAIKEALSIPDVDRSANRLIELALRGGGPENVTVVVADVVAIESDKTRPLPLRAPTRRGDDR